MARRWLRSPRIRNTFMFQPAGPARARRQLLETLRRPRGGRVPGLRVGPALRLDAAALPASSRPGGDVARPATAQGSQEAPPPEVPPPAHPSASAPGGRGGLARLGASGLGPPPASRRSVPARGLPRPAPLMPGEVAAQSPSSASPPQPGVLPHVTLGKPVGSISLPQFRHLYPPLITPVPAWNSARQCWHEPSTLEAPHTPRPTATVIIILGFERLLLGLPGVRRAGA